MAVLLDAGAEAPGSIKSWIRPSSSYPIPSNWLIADGSVVVDPDSPFNTQTLPDLRDKFEKGHPTLTNLNFGADLLYHTGGGGAIPAGGVASHALAHDHPGGSHTHSVAGHTHTIPASGTHSHAIAQHSHSLSAHTHSIPTQTSATSGPAIDGPDVGIFFRYDGFPGDHYHTVPSHNHTGTTGSASPSIGLAATTPAADGDHTHGGVTGAGSGSTGVATGNTDSALSTIDNQPPWIGLVRIVKIK